ncbi:bifunctional adenosylcobinamide kinase/adenosylcobinamide-phosphate guanylyltransferase [Bacillus sp. V33-4]|uniref:bifunctional adenosylcobinamide kinase/adenosylcobinamide-phosphate guanylyltransferase n=1 Tax=Bacillus sp. V33-4 TaxID=2054169 RepID=UPI000C77DEB5|nr:bifunctional adenosylcobinamide kinase/adenosylcobinamide-phosphate guanylyltransferase [Bacillus sp. V33-4]PLR81127.1 hypothetical protein CVD23_19800 [Bacillus sp. V33-4]
MHFVTGGAFNGKSAWVKNFYQLNEQEHLWISAYKGYSLPGSFFGHVVVLEGIEEWLKNCHVNSSIDASREEWQRLLQNWLAWEAGDPARTFVVIGADITKGVVPADPGARQWRDLTGWVYQDIAKFSSRVDLIWYGMSKQLKQGE